MLPGIEEYGVLEESQVFWRWEERRAEDSPLIDDGISKPFDRCLLVLGGDLGGITLFEQPWCSSLTKRSQQRQFLDLLNLLADTLLSLPQCVGYSPENNGLENALSGAEIVVIPAGMPRKPGMSRDDLFNVRPLAARKGRARELTRLTGDRPTPPSFVTSPRLPPRSAPLPALPSSPTPSTRPSPSAPRSSSRPASTTPSGAFFFEFLEHSSVLNQNVQPLWCHHPRRRPLLRLPLVPRWNPPRRDRRPRCWWPLWCHDRPHPLADRRGQEDCREGRRAARCARQAHPVRWR